MIEDEAIVAKLEAFNEELAEAKVLPSGSFVTLIVHAPGGEVLKYFSTLIPSDVVQRLHDAEWVSFSDT